MANGELMRDVKQYLAAVSNADIDAVRSILEGINGDWHQYLFRERLILDDDEDDRDPPRAWACIVDLPPRKRQILAAALSEIPSLRYREVHSMLQQSEHNNVEAWLAAETNLRRQGHVLVSVGTGFADGSKDAQATTTSPILVDQWTEVARLVKMDTWTSRAFVTQLAGNYEFEIGYKDGGPLRFEPVEGVTFGFRAAVHDGESWFQVGDEVRSTDGTVRGSIEGRLGVGYRVALSVRSSEPASFKLLAGSGMRLRRLAI